MSMKTRLLIAATMVTAATLPPIASAGPSDSVVEGTLVSSGRVDKVVSTGGGSGSGSSGFGLLGKGKGQFGNKETITNVNGITQTGTKGRVSGTMVLGTNVGSVINTGTAVNVGGIMQ